jgi:pSer/pThr/pTyr-binding forkhead associated (FHA) protein
MIKYDLPDFGRNDEPHFLILESVNNSNTSSKVIHIINFVRTEEIRMGRGNDTDVRIHDISVSRFHAVIKKTAKGYFYIEDNRSKFGTLALIKHPIILS